MATEAIVHQNSTRTGDVGLETVLWSLTQPCLCHVVQQRAIEGAKWSRESIKQLISWDEDPEVWAALGAMDRVLADLPYPKKSTMIYLSLVEKHLNNAWNRTEPQTQNALRLVKLVSALIYLLPVADPTKPIE